MQSTLKIYENVRTFVTNSVFPLFVLCDGFYFKTCVMLLTFFLYMTGFVTTGLINMLYVTNLLIRSLNHSTGTLNDALINDWITYANITIMCKLVDFITYFFNFFLVTWIFDLGKLFLYYSLITSDFFNAINFGVKRIYTENKMHFDYVQYLVSYIISQIRSSFSMEYFDQLKNKFQNKKSE